LYLQGTSQILLHWRKQQNKKTFSKGLKGGILIHTTFCFISDYIDRLSQSTSYNKSKWRNHQLIVMPIIPSPPPKRNNKGQIDAYHPKKIKGLLSIFTLVLGLLIIQLKTLLKIIFFTKLCSAVLSYCYILCLKMCYFQKNDTFLTILRIICYVRRFSIEKTQRKYLPKSSKCSSPKLS